MASSILPSVLSLFSFCTHHQRRQSSFTSIHRSHLDHSLLPRPKIRESIAIRTDKDQTDVLQHEADIGMDETSGIEFRQAYGQPSLGCPQSR